MGGGRKTAGASIASGGRLPAAAVTVTRPLVAASLSRATHPADEAAKLGAKLCLQPTEALQQEADRVAELLTKVLKVAAELLPLWPSARSANQGKLPRPLRPSAAEVSLANRPQGQLHQWLPGEGLGLRELREPAEQGP